MKVLTVKFYLCDRGHKHTSKQKCRNCDERVVKERKERKKGNSRLLRGQRMRTAYYLHKRGENIAYIATALGLAVATARDILRYAKNELYPPNEWSMIDLVEYKQEWIEWASKMVTGIYTHKPAFVSERDKDIWLERSYGSTFKEIGDKFHISPSRAVQIVNRLNRVWRHGEEPENET